MATIRELLVKLGVDADARSLLKFDKGVTKVKKNLAALARAAAMGGAALMGMTAGLFKVAQDTANVGDAAAKTAKQVGLTAESWQEYEHAANLSGVAGAELISGLGRLARNVRDASEGTGQAADVLKELDINAKKADGTLRETDEIVEELADRVSKMPDSFQKTALMMDLFGRSGTSLIPMLNSGGEGIRKMRREARDLGVVLSNEAAAKSEEFNDSLFRVRQIVKGLRNTIGMELMPIVIDAARRFRDWFETNRDLIDQRVDKLAKAAADAFKQMVTWLERADAAAQALGGWVPILKTIAGLTTAIVAGWASIKIAGIIAGLKTAFAGLSTAIASASGGIAAITAAFTSGGLAAAAGVVWAMVAPFLILAAKVLAVVAVVVALAAAVHDLWKLFTSDDAMKDSLFARMLGKDIVGKLRKAVEKLGELWSKVWQLMLAVLEPVWNVIKTVGIAVLKMYGAYLQWFWNTIAKPVLSALLDFWLFVFEAVIAALDWLLSSWEDKWSSIKNVGDTVATGLKDAFAAAFDWIMSKAQKVVGTVAKYLNKIPGVDIGGSADVGFGGAGAAGVGDDLDASRRSAQGTNMALAMNRGDTNIEINGSGLGQDELTNAVSDGLERSRESDYRKARDTFKGGEK